MSQMIKRADKRQLLNRVGVFTGKRLLEFESTLEGDNTALQAQDIPDLVSIEENNELNPFDGTPHPTKTPSETGTSPHVVTIHHYQRYQRITGAYMSTLVMITEDYLYDGLGSLGGMRDFCCCVSDIHPGFRYTSDFNRIYKLYKTDRVRRAARAI
jgi:hypothetical protein